MNAARVLPRVGLWGALLTVVILAMTVLLRLTTRLEGAEMVSTLAPDVTQWVRLIHRVAAGGVGVLAALAFVAARNRTTYAIVGLTLLLAMVGRHSAGYRSDLATVVNVAGGIALAAAFWRLRGGAMSLAVWALVAAAVFGAATDAAAMRGERAFGPLHMGFGALFVVCALAAAWRWRSRAAVAWAIALLTLAQAALGLYLLAAGRPVGAGWIHAMVACGLALLLTRGKPGSLKGA